MGVHDLDARFDAVTTGQGTIARSAVDAIHQAARTINDQVVGEPYQLVTVVQALETAAHQARLYLDFPPEDQPGIPPEGSDDVPAPPKDPYDGMTIDDLRAEITRRNEVRETNKLAVSGTKPELLERLRADDTGQLSS
jgi:hypothetical protein